ncbi:hypothetical protein COOONC_05916 [Cooperia oncophora]
MVIVFIHMYGSLEHAVDVGEEYPEHGGLTILGPASDIFFAVYDIVPFAASIIAFMGFLESVKEADVLFLFLFSTPHDLATEF